MKRISGIGGVALALSGTAASSQVFQKVRNLEDDVDVVMVRPVGPLEPEHVESLMRGMTNTENVATYLYLYSYNVSIRPDPIAKETNAQNAIRVIIRDQSGADWQWSLKSVQRTDEYTFMDCASPNPKCNMEIRQ